MLFLTNDGSHSFFDDVSSSLFFNRKIDFTPFSLNIFFFSVTTKRNVAYFDINRVTDFDQKT